MDPSLIAIIAVGASALQVIALRIIDYYFQEDRLESATRSLSVVPCMTLTTSTTRTKRTKEVSRE